MIRSGMNAMRASAPAALRRSSEAGRLPSLWFAITFWVFLETRSVFATGMIGGIFLVFTTLTGIWLGSLVDHHPKKTVLQASAAVSLVLYAASLAVYLLSPPEAFRRTDSVWLWVFVLLLMLGVIAGNVRMIGQADVDTALKEVRPSVGPWFETARNVALFANEDGTYDELLAYLRKSRRL